MAALARALMARPRLLLLDEPSLGIAPQIVETIAEAILMFRKEGMTILLVEQNARIALALANRGYVMERRRRRVWRALSFRK
jgi:branched-chain amino acid transport system ATP-binding protein